MNISSVIISVRDAASVSGVLTNLAQIEACEIIASEGEKIVAVLTAKDVSEEIRLFRQIEQIDGVLAVAMVYAYQEDVEFDKNKLELTQELSSVLTDETIDARDIVYNGHINSRDK